jgi:DNA-binding Xre family transcriptional regulator
MDKNINRLKVVLAEKNKPNKWLVEQLGVSPTTVSKWVTNTSQPPMETFMKIAQLLEVDINELLRFEELDNSPLNVGE